MTGCHQICETPSLTSSCKSSRKQSLLSILSYTFFFARTLSDITEFVNEQVKRWKFTRILSGDVDPVQLLEYRLRIKSVVRKFEVRSYLIYALTVLTDTLSSLHISKLTRRYSSCRGTSCSWRIISARRASIRSNQLCCNFYAQSENLPVV